MQLDHVVLWLIWFRLIQNLYPSILKHNIILRVRHVSSLFYMHIHADMMYLVHGVVKALRRAIYKQQSTRCKSLSKH